MSKIRATVIIAFYKNIPFLELLLQGLLSQTFKEFEIVIAEDDNDKATLLLIEKYADVLRIKHVCHPDDGFRKCRILNQALLIAKGERIIFLDGDCIPHPQFVNTYVNIAADVAFGRRVMLSKTMTKNWIAHKKVKPSFLDYLKFGFANFKHALYLPWYKSHIAFNKGIWGCNWFINRNLLLKINGFDEDYVLAGVGEDVDIEWRLRKSNCKIYYVKHLAIVYHLFHTVHYDSDTVNKGLEMLATKHQLGDIFCKNGLTKV